MSWMMVSMAMAKPLVAVVVVDREAREEGYAIEIDGWLVEDALPVDVAQGEVLQLIAPDGQTERMNVAAGEAWEVAGAKGETWMSLLDDEIRTDLLVVTGDRQAIADLAHALDAQVLEEDGKLYLSGGDIVLDAGWVDQELALQIEEVSFVKVRAREEEPDAKVERPALTDRPVILPTPAVSAPPPADEQTTLTAPPEAVRKVEGPIAVERIERVPAPEPVAEAFPSDEVLEELAHYSGIHVCGGQVLVNLRADGTWAFDDGVGYWHASAPNLVRLQTFEGDTLYKAAFDDQLHCRAVWAPDSRDTHAGLQHSEKRKDKRRRR